MLERLSNIVCSITSLNPVSGNYAYNPNGNMSGYPDEDAARPPKAPSGHPVERPLFTI